MGSLIAGYRIDEVVGRGRLGIVYRATDVMLERPVALKLIDRRLERDPSLRMAAAPELKRVALIDHPNVIPVHDAGEDEGTLFIAMRYVAGTDLGALVAQEGPLDPRRVANITRQVAKALDAAHAAGLVHRDVKPGNVLIEDRDGRDHVFLTDFGLSMQTASAAGLTTPEGFVATLDYVAPEQIGGEAVDGRADVYALGCVLFHALTGRAPYALRSDAEKLWAHMYEPPPAASGVCAGAPAALDAVIRRAMAKRPDDRYASAGSLGRAAVDAVRTLADTPVREQQLIFFCESWPTEGGGVPDTFAEDASFPPNTARDRPPARPGPRSAGREADAIVETAPTASGRPWLAPPSPPHDRTPYEHTGPDGYAEPSPPRGHAAAEHERLWPEWAPPAPPSNDTHRPQPSPAHEAWGYAPPAPPHGGRADASLSRSAPTRAGYDGAHERSATTADRRRRRRRPIVLGATVALLAAATVVAVTVARDSGGTGGSAASPPQNARTIAVGAGPADLAATRNAVWVADRSGDSLTRIDMRTNRTREVPAGDKPRAVAVGEGALWVTDGFGRLDRLDPESGKRVGRPRVPGTDAYDVAAGAGSVWMANGLRDTVTRLDARTRTAAPGSPITVDREPSAIAVGEGAAWVANANSVTRIDTNTSRPVGDPIPVGGASAIAAGEGSVWVTSRQNNTVARIDPRTGKVVGRPIAVGRAPSAVAVGAGAVWVTNEADNTLTRIDAREAKVVGGPIAVGKAPSSVAVGDDAVWVANRDADSVTRVALT